MPGVWLKCEDLSILEVVSPINARQTNVRTDINYVVNRRQGFWIRALVDIPDENLMGAEQVAEGRWPKFQSRSGS